MWPHIGRVADFQPRSLQNKIEVLEWGHGALVTDMSKKVTKVGG